MATTRRIPELDGLRGLAILLVLSLHYISDSQGGGFGSLLYRFKAIFRLGWSGVDLFFVLSGFLIGGILLRAKESGDYYKIFYLRRFHRIFPIYYLWIGLYIVVRIFNAHFPQVLPFAPNGTSSLLVYFLFLQNWISMPFKTFEWYWFAVTWSLAVEEQFYLIAPVLVKSLSLRSLVVTLSATVALAPALREILFRYNRQGMTYVLVPCRADALALGMLAAIAWSSDGVKRRLQAQKKAIYVALITFFCGSLVLLKYFPGTSSQLTATLGFSWLAFFFVMLLFAVLVDSSGVLARMMRLNWLGRLGGISYCIYLIHLSVNGILHAVLLKSQPNVATLSGVSVTLLAAFLTFGIATMSWKYFEGPLMQRGHRYEYGPPATNASMEGQITVAVRTPD